MRPYTTVRCETAIHSTWSCNSRWSCIIWQCSESDAKKEESRVETRLSKQVQYWRSVNHALFGLSFMRMFFLFRKKQPFFKFLPSSSLPVGSLPFALWLPLSCWRCCPLRRCLAVRMASSVRWSGLPAMSPVQAAAAAREFSSKWILEYLGLVSAVQLDEFYMVLKTCTAYDSFHKWGYPQLSSIYKWIFP